MIHIRFPILFLLLCLLAGCGAVAPSATVSCPVTEPIWIKPPEDAAIPDAPAFGYYYANEDRSILTSAWWWEQKDDPLLSTEEGIKLGWFRPAGESLEISGRRIDANAPALEADVPAGYPTRFQASGIYFPSEGCWEVTAKAGESRLAFVVWVEPAEGK
jgi:hypothetical protein